MKTSEFKLALCHIRLVVEGLIYIRHLYRENWVLIKVLFAQQDFYIPIFYAKHQYFVFLFVIMLSPFDFPAMEIAWYSFRQKLEWI